MRFWTFVQQVGCHLLQYLKITHLGVTVNDLELQLRCKIVFIIMIDHIFIARKVPNHDSLSPQRRSVCYWLMKTVLFSLDGRMSAADRRLKDGQPSFFPHTLICHSAIADSPTAFHLHFQLQSFTLAVHQTRIVGQGELQGTQSTDWFSRLSWPRYSPSGKSHGRLPRLLVREQLRTICQSVCPTKKHFWALSVVVKK